jgi:hypothetical protein
MRTWTSEDHSAIVEVLVDPAKTGLSLRAKECVDQLRKAGAQQVSSKVATNLYRCSGIIADKKIYNESGIQTRGRTCVLVWSYSLAKQGQWESSVAASLNSFKPR